jgi:hypothetical protein
MLPFTPITEELVPSSWINDDYPVLSQALGAAAPGWRGYIYMVRRCSGASECHFVFFFIRLLSDGAVLWMCSRML